jgi:6-phosphogluconolactonase
MARLTIVADEEALAVESAERVTRGIEGAVADRGSAVLALTGGRTPQRLYGLLGDETHSWRARIDWVRVHLFWGDERHVPPDHPDSNFAMANRALIRHVPIPAAQVHRIRGEMPDATDGARDYEHALRDGFAAAGRADRTFDLILLGLGEDAHVASIFPGSPLLGPHPDSTGGVAAVWASHLHSWRITLAPAALLDARAIVMLVSGEEKSPAMQAAVELPENIQRWPAQLLRPAGERVEWILDRAAASRLSRDPDRNAP